MRRFCFVYKIYKICSFTLIELLLVLTIALAAVAAVGINVRGLLAEQRFNNETSAVASTLKLAQELMLLLQIDVAISFVSNDGVIEYKIQADGVINELWKKLLLKKRGPLNAISKIYLINNKGAKEESFTLKFLSQGTTMTQGVLALESPYSEPLGISLPGFPTIIQLMPISQATEHFEKQLRETLSLSDQLTPTIQREIKPPKDSE